MKRLRLLLLLLAWLTLCPSQAATADKPADTTQPAIFASAERPKAVLSDTTSLYRICNSRPQRILPTHGPRPHSTGRQSISLKSNTQKPSFHNRSARQEAAPFALAAPCDYYVFALKRLRC